MCSVAALHCLLGNNLPVELRMICEVHDASGEEMRFR